MNGERQGVARGIDRPTRRQVYAYARALHVAIPSELHDAARESVAESLDVFDRLEKLGNTTVPLRYPDRDPGRQPTEDEDPHDAIIRFCNVKGAEHGPLAGWRIGVKDNIAVAGVPMTEGHPELTTVPSEDAVVVERILDAGATIVAKTNINTGNDAYGVTRNPHNPDYAAGGSSSGSAAAVAAGTVDAAIGVDQGGSIRHPAAWCGIVGMKPTHGLVPSYGLAYWDHTLDHVGPMTRTVADNAAMLEVLAGGDWRDPQWVRAEPTRGSYMSAAGVGVDGLRIGIVTEAADSTACSTGTVNAFRRAAGVLEDIGARVSRVSIPLWNDASAIWLATVTFGLMAMADTYGQGHGHLGRVDVDRITAVADQYRRGIRGLPWLSPTLPLTFAHLQAKAPGLHAALAQNLRLELRRQVDELLRHVDLLITPTMPTGPVRLPTEHAGPEEPVSYAAVRTGLTNTAVNLTGHPALTVPSGPGDHELPTGLQIIGRHFDEHTVYRAGFAFEAPDA